MELVIGTIMIAVAVALFVLGYLAKDLVLTFGSATLFLLVGLSLMAGGLQIVTGQTISKEGSITEINSSYQTIWEEAYITNTYTSYEAFAARALGLLFLAIGIYLSFICWDLYKSNKDMDDGSLLDKMRL